MGSSGSPIRSDSASSGRGAAGYGETYGQGDPHMHAHDSSHFQLQLQQQQYHHHHHQQAYNETAQYRVLQDQLSNDVAGLKAQLKKAMAALTESEGSRKQDQRDHEEKLEAALHAATNARDDVDKEARSKAKLEEELTETRRRVLALEADLDDVRTSEAKLQAKYKRLKEQVAKQPESTTSSSGRKMTKSKERGSEKTKIGFGSTVKENKPSPYTQKSTKSRSSASSRSGRPNSAFKKAAPSQSHGSADRASRPVIESQEAGPQHQAPVVERHSRDPDDFGYDNGYGGGGGADDGQGGRSDQGWNYDHGREYDIYDSPQVVADKVGGHGARHGNDGYDADNYSDYLLGEASRQHDSFSPATMDALDEKPVGGGSSGAMNVPDEQGFVERAGCQICGRRFDKSRLAAHTRICSVTSNKKRRPMDAQKARLQGTDAEKAMRSTVGGGSSKPSNWRAKSEALRAALKAARDPNSAPAPAFEDPSYVTCDSCGRTFSEAAAERHIPKCRSSQGIRNPSRVSKSSRSKGRYGR